MKGLHLWLHRDSLQLCYLPELPARNRTPSPSATAIICARLFLIRILIAFLSNTIGIPDNSEGMGGSMISYRVNIVFSCPVDVAQSCRTSAHSSGSRQYNSTDRVCLGGSYVAVPLAAMSAIMKSKYGGCKRRLILSLRNISSQSLPGFSASSTLMVNSLRCRA